MFIDYWLENIRSADTASTYKMAWAKAITHLAYDMELDSAADDVLITINLKDIANKFFSYYWDQDVFFKLHQNSNPHKLATIVSLVRKAEADLNELKGTQQPYKYFRAEPLLKAMKGNYHDKLMVKVVKLLKQDVSHRFLSSKLKESPFAPAYMYTEGEDTLQMRADYLKELKENLNLVLDVINLKWVLVLEQYNMSPRIGRKVRHMDMETDGRKPLMKYHRHLILENPEMKCFICGKSITDEKAAVDHVIPWSFMYSDDLWNLVFVHRSCNSRKSNTVPSEKEIELLKERNKRLLTLMKNEPVYASTKMCFELSDAIIHDLARKFWIQCQG